MKLSAHQTPDVPVSDPDSPDPANDWPDKERHRPDEVREPPRPRTPPIREPLPPDQAFCATHILPIASAWSIASSRVGNRTFSGAMTR